MASVDSQPAPACADAGGTIPAWQAAARTMAIGHAAWPRLHIDHLTKTVRFFVTGGPPESKEFSRNEHS